MKKKIRKKLLGFDVGMTNYSTLEEDEEDLVGEYFRLPRGAETGEFMRTAVAKQLLSAPGMNLSTVALGRAFALNLRCIAKVWHFRPVPTSSLRCSNVIYDSFR